MFIYLFHFVLLFIFVILFTLVFVVFCFGCSFVVVVVVFLLFFGVWGNVGESINLNEYWGFEGDLSIIISAGQSN